MIDLITKEEAIVVYTLNSSERQLLSTKAIKGSENEQAQVVLLSSIKQESLWLRCDCTDDPAIMTIRNRDGNLHLVNIHNRGHHSEQCAFYKLINNKDKEKTAHEKLGMKQSFNFHKLATEKKVDPEAPIVKSGQKNKQSEDTLYRLIACLFESAGINEISSRMPLVYKERVKRILSAAEQFRLGSKSLRSEMFWGIVNHAKAYEAIEKEIADKTDINNVPTKLILSVIDNYDFTDMGMTVTSTIRNPSGEKKINITLDADCKVVLANKRFTSEDAPFILAYTLIYDTKDNRNIIRVGRAYIRPLASIHNLIPCDNRFERSAINKCESVYDYNKKRGNILKIVRPLLSISAPISHQAIRPDIIMHSAYNKAIINVFANSEEEYLKVRHGQTQYMEEIAQVYNITPEQSNDTQEGQLTISDGNIHEIIKASAKFVLNIED